MASMCKHIAAALYGVGARLDDDPSLCFTLRGINIDDIITQTVAETAQTLLGKARRQRDNILEDEDLGEVFGIQLEGIEAPVSNLPPVRPKTSKTKKTAKGKNATFAKKSAGAGKKIEPKRSLKPQKNLLPAVKADHLSATMSPTRKQRLAAVPPNVPQGTMLDALVKAVGKARKGKSVEQLQDRLGWTKIQIRNAISRADAKGLIETVKAGHYRQKV
jgi:uncharacterized Zn finger protein